MNFNRLDKMTKKQMYDHIANLILVGFYEVDE